MLAVARVIVAKYLNNLFEKDKDNSRLELENVQPRRIKEFSDAWEQK